VGLVSVHVPMPPKSIQVLVVRGIIFPVVRDID
jgi:hypothetical protein